MPRFFALSMFLTTTFALMVGVALMIGRGQPPSQRIERLHLADCALPCWNGITPGVSSSSQVTARIDTLSPKFQGPATSATSNTGSSKSLIWTQYSDIDQVVRMVDVTLQNGRVESLSIGTDRASEDMPRLSEVLAVFGSPACVNIDVRSGFTTMVYENAAHQFALGFSVFPLALATPVNNFQFGAADNLNCRSSFAVSWPTFRRLRPALLHAS